jgi:predicted dienelactone hydrolase
MQAKLKTRTITRHTLWIAAILLIAGAIQAPAGAQPAPQSSHNRIDQIRPDAPELAEHGSYSIGVRTLELSNPGQLDLVAIDPESKPPQDNGSMPGSLPRYDRPLTVEVWYPAKPGNPPTPYRVFLRDGETEVTINGRASRAAEPDPSGAPYPLVLISHGYPGNRFLMSHLGENLASKGYVVASIDHTDSTYRTRAAFASTLVNRPLDQIFVLDEMAKLAADRESFLGGLADTDNTGLIGYSMGGYGAVITAGGGITAQAVEEGAPAGTLAMHRAGSKEHAQQFDSRIKAIVGFAPWGMTAGIWDADGLAGIKIPTLFIAGSVDDVSGYEKGVRAIFEQAIHSERSLLTFENANHNAAAPMPAPLESYAAKEGDTESFFHYADPVWDTVRMNNIAQHFVTAWFGKRLKGDASMDAYLDLVPDSNAGVWSLNDDGTPTPEHSYWRGFSNRTAKGLRFETLVPEP